MKKKNRVCYLNKYNKKNALHNANVYTICWWGPLQHNHFHQRDKNFFLFHVYNTHLYLFYRNILSYCYKRYINWYQLVWKTRRWVTVVVTYNTRVDTFIFLWVFFFCCFSGCLGTDCIIFDSNKFESLIFRIVL